MSLLGKLHIVYCIVLNVKLYFCCRRRIHIQNTEQGSSGATDRQNRPTQRQQENAPNATAQNFHRNLVYTISEAVMDAINSAQLTRMQGPDGTNRPAATPTNQDANTNQASARAPPLQVPPFIGLMPHIQNMVNGKQLCVVFIKIL